MIGALNPSSREATVIGGGIAGLLAAYSLGKQGYQVHLYEKQNRLGGLIETKRLEWGIAEAAAHSFLATTAVTELCQEIGVELLPIQPDSKARWILKNGKLRKFPLSFLEAMATLGRASFKTSQGNSDLTLGQWAKYFLGTPAHDYLITPMVRGIYGASPDELSLSASFPDLAVPQGHSLVSSRLLKLGVKPRERARSAVMVPKLGMGDVVEKLAIYVQAQLNVKIHLGTQLTVIPEVENLVLTVPAPSAANLLDSVDPGLSQALREINYTPLVSATVFVAKKDLALVPSGVGVLIPDQESRPILGVLFNSSSFSGRVADPDHVVSFSVFLGGTLRRDIVEMSDTQVSEMIVKELHSLFGLKADPLRVLVHKHRYAIPLYNSHLIQVLEQAREGWCSRPGHILFGNYTGQVSLRGMIEALSGQTSLQG